MKTLNPGSWKNGSKLVKNWNTNHCAQGAWWVALEETQGQESDEKITRLSGKWQVRECVCGPVVGMAFSLKGVLGLWAVRLRPRRILTQCLHTTYWDRLSKKIIKLSKLFRRTCNGKSLGFQVLKIYLYRLTLFYCALLYRASEMLSFLEIEGRTLHEQKDYDLRYCHGWSGTKPTISLRYACIWKISTWLVW